VLLIDGLDEAIDQSGTNIRFASELRSLLYSTPHVMSSRTREYQDVVAIEVEDIDFDEVYVIEPWNVDQQFRDYLARLTEADLLHEPELYELVASSERLSSLVSRPLYARMLTFVGEQSAQRLTDNISLYGEYLAKLAHVANLALRRTAPQTPDVLGIWQTAVAHLYASSSGDRELVPLNDMEEALSQTLPLNFVRRALDYIIDRRSIQGREVGEFLHYSFFEYLVARQICDELVGEPDATALVSILRNDLSREIRHYLTGQLRTARGDNLRETLLSSYSAIRTRLEISERDRLSACNLLIYLVSRVISDSNVWLGQLLDDESNPFLQHAILWAMCHLGSREALTVFFGKLQADYELRSQCRGYVLYYYGDIPRRAAPPYQDEAPHVSCRLSSKRVLDLLASREFRESVAIERKFVDVYTFCDVLAVRGVRLTGRDEAIIRDAGDSLRSSDLPAMLMQRIGEMIDGVSAGGADIVRP
jgi:hypothetical protein